MKEETMEMKEEEKEEETPEDMYNKFRFDAQNKYFTDY